ncbi:hypothetical protein ACFL6S_14860 [Candidatus Poribacteria bacterium]
MKKVSLAVLGILFVGGLIASAVGAFEIGENYAENSDFEIGEVGSTPAEWQLQVSG